MRENWRENGKIMRRDKNEAFRVIDHNVIETKNPNQFNYF
jgi:hypothetical protein